MKKVVFAAATFALALALGAGIAVITPQQSHARLVCDVYSEHWYFSTHPCTDAQGRDGYWITKCAGWNYICWDYDMFGNCIGPIIGYDDCSCRTWCYTKPYPWQQDPIMQP